VPKSRLIVAAIVDLHNLRELGRGAFPFRLIFSPLIALSTLPNLPPLLKSKMAAIAFTPQSSLLLKSGSYVASVPPKNMPALQVREVQR